MSLGNVNPPSSCCCTWITNRRKHGIVGFSRDDSLFINQELSVFDKTWRRTTKMNDFILAFKVICSYWSSRAGREILWLEVIAWLRTYAHLLYGWQRAWENPALWLATRAVKMEWYCPLGIAGLPVTSGLLFRANTYDKSFRTGLEKMGYFFFKEQKISP